jgi:hypothetical protein
MWFTTDRIDLAAALLTLGVPLAEGAGIARMQEGGKEVYGFNFQASVPGVNGMTAGTAGSLWCNWPEFKKWEAEHPEDPFSYLRVAAHNRERILDAVKQSKLVHVVRKDDGKIYLVTER